MFWACEKEHSQAGVLSNVLSVLLSERRGNDRQYRLTRPGFKDIS